MSDPKVLKNLDVVFGTIASFLLTWHIVDRTHECNKFIWNDPVQVAIFYLLIVLVFFIVEIFEFVPAEANRELKAF